MSRCTARRRTSPAKAWPTRLPCSLRSAWRCATHSIWSKRPTRSMRRSRRRWRRGCVPPTSSLRAPKSSALRRWARRSSANWRRYRRNQRLLSTAKPARRSVFPENQIRAEVLCELKARRGHQAGCRFALLKHFDLHHAAIVAQRARHSSEHFALITLDVDLDRQRAAGQRHKIVKTDDVDIVTVDL